MGPRSSISVLACSWIGWLVLLASHADGRALQQQSSIAQLVQGVKPVPPLLPPPIRPSSFPVPPTEPGPVQTEPEPVQVQVQAAAAAAVAVEPVVPATAAEEPQATAEQPQTAPTAEPQQAAAAEQPSARGPPQASAAEPGPDRFIVKVDPRCGSRGSPGGGRISALAAQSGGSVSVAAAAQAVQASPAPITLTHIYDDASTVMPGFAFKAGQPGSPETSQLLSELDADPCIVGVYHDRPSYPTSATYPTLPLNFVPTSVMRANAANLEATRVNNPSSFDIAVVDSGIGEHPDLNVFQSLDCTATDEANGKGCRPRTSQFDLIGHGTLMAGMMAAKNGWERDQIPAGTLVGMAPGTALHSLQVLRAVPDPATNATTFIAFTSDIIAALNWVRTYNSRISLNSWTGRYNGRKIRVINLSFWVENNTPTDGMSIANNPDFPDCGAADPGITPFHTAICRVSTDTVNGAVVVTSAGNMAADIESGIPARFPEVLTATSMTANAAVLSGPFTTCNEASYTVDSGSYFSNYVNLTNPESLAASHTVAAPGECVISTVPRSMIATGYGIQSGTSLSTAAVSGFVALCFGELKTNMRFAQTAAQSSNGRCEAAFAAGGAPAVIKMLVEDATFRQAGDSVGFFGDPMFPMTVDDVPAKSFGYLINAASL